MIKNSLQRYDNHDIYCNCYTRDCPHGAIPNKESMTAAVILEIVPVEWFPYQKTSNNLSKYHTTIYNNTTIYTASMVQSLLACRLYILCTDFTAEMTLIAGAWSHLVAR